MIRIFSFILLILPISLLAQSNGINEWVADFVRLNNRPPTPSETEAFLTKQDSILVSNFKNQFASRRIASIETRDTIVKWLDEWIELNRNFPHSLLDARLDAYFEYSKDETLAYLMNHWDVVRHNTSINLDSWQPYNTSNRPFLVFLFKKYELIDILTFLSKDENAIYKHKKERTDFILNVIFRLKSYSSNNDIKNTLKIWFESTFELNPKKDINIQKYRKYIISILSK